MEVKDYQSKLDTAKEKLAKMENTKIKHENKIKKLEDTLIKNGYDLDSLDKYAWIDEPYEMRDAKFNLDIARDDLKYKLKDIENQKQIVNNWETRINQAINKENIINNSIPQLFKKSINT